MEVNDLFRGVLLSESHGFFHLVPAKLSMPRPAGEGKKTRVKQPEVRRQICLQSSLRKEHENA